MKHNWMVSVCCNNPDNGHFAGRAHAFAFQCGDYEMQLVAARREPVFKWHFGHRYRMQIGRRKIPCDGHREWVGNWCWDGTRMKTRHVRQLVFELIKAGYDIESGTGLLWNWFKRMKTQYDRLEELT